jgi:hypothetical protein
MIVIVREKNPNEIMDIVRLLRAQGLVQGQDFDFAYYPQDYDFMNSHLNSPKHTKFTFYDEKWGTWFALQWS